MLKIYAGSAISIIFFILLSACIVPMAFGIVDISSLLNAATSEDAVKAFEEALSECKSYEDYEKLAADLKALAQTQGVNNQDVLYYAVARTRTDQLASLSKSNDIESGRLYMSMNDKYYNEALDYLRMAEAATKSNALALETDIVKFLIFKEKFQPRRIEAVFDEILNKVLKYSPDPAVNKAVLFKVFDRLNDLGLNTYAVKLKIDYASRVDADSAREIFDDIKKAADRYFGKGDMKASGALYEQYIQLAPPYFAKDEIAAHTMEIGEKYFGAGKYRDANKYYLYYMEKYGDSPVGDYCGYKIALCYYYMKDHVKAIDQLCAFLPKYQNSAWFDKAFEMLARIYYEGLPKEQAISGLQELIDKYYRKNIGDYAQFLIGMLYYRAKEYDTAAEKLKKIEPASIYSYAAETLLDDIKSVWGGNKPYYGTDSTDTYKVWDPDTGIGASIVPSDAPGVVGGIGKTKKFNVTQDAEDGSMKLDVSPGARIRFELTGLIDDDKFAEYAQDKEDMSRLPKKITEAKEKDFLSLQWSSDGGKFSDDNQSGKKVWEAPREPGIYKISARTEDLGLIRVPDIGSKKDSSKEITIMVVVGD